MFKIFIIWLQVANFILASIIFFAVPRQATLELSGRFCPDQDIFFKKSSWSAIYGISCEPEWMVQSKIVIRNHDLMKGTKQAFDWMGGFRSSFIIE